MSVKFSTKGNAVVGLKSLLKRLENRKPVMDKIGETMVRSTEVRFNIGKDPNGNDWDPSIRAIREGNRTLVDTGRLKNSIKYFADENKVVIGTNVPYAKWHQTGTKRMKARPFLGVSKIDSSKILKIVNKYLKAQNEG